MEPYNVIFFGNVDLAQISLYAFWLFFAGLVIYLQRKKLGKFGFSEMPT